MKILRLCDLKADHSMQEVPLFIKKAGKLVGTIVVNEKGNFLPYFFGIYFFAFENDYPTLHSCLSKLLNEGYIIAMFENLDSKQLYDKAEFITQNEYFESPSSFIIGYVSGYTSAII